MAIKIPIISVFDGKGFKQAEYQLRKVQGNFSNLGRNFAIAGAALGAVGVALGKSITAASNLEAEFEGVNQVFGSAAGSVQAFAKQAATSAGLTETAALQASKVFGLFATGAGQSEQEAAKFATTMVQLAGDLGSFNDVPTEEALAAIQSGLQGQAEPLRKFGVFLDDARLKQEALNMGIYDGEGPLNQQQKMMAAYESILKQTNIQQGDFVKYADTYGNQLKTLQSEFANLSAEVGQQLLPVMADFIPVLRDVVAELGPKLKEAIASVDWESIATAIGNLIIFLVENAETIMKVVGAIWLLNTAYNLGRVAIGLYNAGAAILNGTLLAQKGTIEATTGAAGRLSTALRLIGVAAAVYAVVTEYQRLKGAVEQAAPTATSFNKEVFSLTGAASRLNPIQQSFFRIGTAIMTATANVFGYKSTASGINSITYGPQVASINAIEAAWKKAQAAKINYGQSGAMWGGANSGFNTGFTMTTPLPKGKVFVPGVGLVDDIGGGGNGGAGGKALANGLKALKQSLKKQQRSVNLTKKLINKGLPTGLIGDILGGANPFKTAKQILTGTDAAAKKLAKKYNKIQKAQEALKQTGEETAEAMSMGGGGGGGSRQVSAEEEAYKQRVENLRSFQEAVKDVFGSIQESILKAFDLPELGDSTNTIIRNMNKLLDKTKAFASNISQLSTMGLNAELLQQIISQGPLAGARIAAALVAGGATALSEINAGYAEMLAVSGQIANVGATSLASTPQQTNIYNIEVGGGMLTSGAEMGRAIVDAIKAYERTSGAVWSPA